MLIVVLRFQSTHIIFSKSAFNWYVFVMGCSTFSLKYVMVFMYYLNKFQALSINDSCHIPVYLYDTGPRAAKSQPIAAY